MADACGKMCCVCVVVLTAIRSNNNEMPFVGSSAWISLTDALKPMDPSMSDMRTVTIIIILPNLITPLTFVYSGLPVPIYNRA